MFCNACVYKSVKLSTETIRPSAKTGAGACGAIRLRTGLHSSIPEFAFCTGLNTHRLGLNIPMYGELGLKLVGSRIRRSIAV